MVYWCMDCIGVVIDVYVLEYVMVCCSISQCMYLDLFSVCCLVCHMY